MKALPQQEDILILTKTYPHPSKKYRETTCVAAVLRSGELRRLFPIPFRFLDGEQQFQKWEWVTARLFKAPKDHRPESYRIDIDSIERTNLIIGTQQGWSERRRWIEPHIVENFTDLEQRRLTEGQTLGVLRPKRLLGLDITSIESEWTDDEEASLRCEGLFDSDVVRSRPTLRKVPYTFHYRYECETPNSVEQFRHMITDWEVGALYWNCLHSHDEQWERPFRQRLEDEFSQKDLLFLMGTMHRFRNQWLIIGLIYPPQLPFAQLRLGLDV